MLNLILALIALGILVTVHEAGHFIAARLCGVKVEVFSIGFGKPMLKFVKKEIEYRIGWIPLGGYVKMKGEALGDEADDDPADPESFRFTQWWKKVIIAFAGPMSNLVLAILIFILTFIMPSKTEDQIPVVGKSSGQYSLIFAAGDSIMSVNNSSIKGWYQFIAALKANQQNTVVMQRNGERIRVTLPAVKPESLSVNVLPAVTSVIGDVSPGMPAWRAGLKQGDKIIAVDSVSVKDWYDMREKITYAAKDTVLLTIQRGNAILRRGMPLEKNPLNDEQRLIGITQQMRASYTQSYPPATAIGYGLNATINFIALNYIGLYKIITNPSTIKNSVGGPVMMYSLSSQSAGKGWTSWIMFIAAISLVLMIMNLLPIPVLDGGHIMFALIQAVRGKPLSIKTQIIAQNIGFTLLMMLMLYAFYNDFTKVFARAVSTMGR